MNTIKTLIVNTCSIILLVVTIHSIYICFKISYGLVLKAILNCPFIEWKKYVLKFLIDMAIIPALLLIMVNLEPEIAKYLDDI